MSSNTRNRLAKLEAAILPTTGRHEGYHVVFGHEGTDDEDGQRQIDEMIARGEAREGDNFIRVVFVRSPRASEPEGAHQ